MVVDIHGAQRAFVDFVNVIQLTEANELIVNLYLGLGDRIWHRFAESDHSKNSYILALQLRLQDDLILQGVLVAYVNIENTIAAGDHGKSFEAHRFDHFPSTHPLSGKFG